MMMKSYVGTYQTKKLIQPVEAQILLEQNSMIIKTADGSEVEWFYGMIKRKQNRDGILQLMHEGKSGETILVADNRILQEIKQLAPYTSIDQFKPWWRTANGLYVLLATKFGLIIFGVIIYFLLVPVMIDVAVNHISIEAEKSLGNKIKEGFFVEAPLDSLKTVEVNEFIDALKLPGDYPIKVSVLKSDEKNAFALPGGEIMIYSGIFSVMKSYPELVALMGHEIGHIEEKHSLKLLCRQASSGIILMIAIGNFSGVTSTIFNNANVFHQLSYSRRYEEEADFSGLDFMKKNQVNQNGMVDLFEHLKNSERQSESIQFLSTHPLLEKRISKIRKAIQETKQVSEENNSLSESWEKIKASNN